MADKSRVFANIDQTALAANAQVAVASGCRVMAVVKANAYGHGIENVAPVLAREGGIDYLAVACLAEALNLHQLIGEEKRIFLLSPAMACEIEQIISCGFVPCLSSAEEIAAYEMTAQRLGVKNFPVHLSIDTGMGRMGFVDADQLIKIIRGLEFLRIEGIASHLPSADEDEVFTAAQIKTFTAIIEKIFASGCVQPDICIHVANSAGLLGYPAATHAPFNLVRPGLMLYGVSPIAAEAGKITPVLSLQAPVVSIRELPAGWGVSYGRTFVLPQKTRVATLPIGYADGYKRHLSNADACVLLGGRRCPVLGRVTMDMIMVDVSNLQTAAKVGDIVTLLGSSGDENITATELAEKSATIPWEIFTGLGDRVQRVVKTEDKEVRN